MSATSAIILTGNRVNIPPLRRQKMIEKTITSIENKVSDAKSIDEKDRVELLKLLGELKTEVTELSKTHAEHAESITGFAKVSAHEAIREKKNPQLIKLSLKGLSSSVDEMESSHPQLVAVVNKISQILANMGI
ncbi:MAG: putative cytosolic protein [Deltaproteobacteria bacterium]|jgi:tyrosyl-tRNA synthetase|nr:putative cytosolic protein [Deltaproteobacteria bacterium]